MTTEIYIYNSFRVFYYYFVIVEINLLFLNNVLGVNQGGIDVEL